MKVIYLVGMGRSGSTLLDILLGSHSNIRALGGIRRIANEAKARRWGL
ncbi:sulfotransferase [Spiribacter sp. 2438]|nr:sulfotransferase [Spiribacter sp. 2438]